MSLADTVYFKDIKSQILKPGAALEVRKKATFKGKVHVRISSTQPVLVNIAGPHIEQTEVRGVKEYSFTVEPGTEFYVGIRNKKGILAKSANVTLEVEMLGPKKVIEVYNRVKNMFSMLQEAPEFYELQKDNVKDILREVTDVWNQLGDEGKMLVKELMKLVKKLEKQE